MKKMVSTVGFEPERHESEGADVSSVFKENLGVGKMAGHCELEIAWWKGMSVRGA